MKYEGIIFFGQSLELAGRGLAGPRLRTSAKNAGYNIFVTDTTTHLSVEQIFNVIDIFVKRGIKFVGFSLAWVGKNVFKDLQNKTDVWLTEEFFVEFRQRYPELLIITGGHKVPGKMDLILSNSNYHFNGFSDISFVKFLDKINGKENTLQLIKNDNKVNGYIIDSNVYYPVENPNDIETVFTEEDMFESYQPLPIELSRGCIFRCAFCTHPFQGKKTYDSYMRTPENIASELKRNYELFGTTRYTIMDDTFNDSMEKLYRLQKALEISKLPNFEFVAYIKPELLVTKPEMIQLLGDMGLKGALIGIESFKNETRKVIGKGTNIEKVKESIFKLAESNVLIHGSFIIGLPFETPDEILETVDFLRNNSKTFCRSWLFKPLIIDSIAMDIGEKSLFEKTPELYGYVTNKHDRYFWDNKIFTNTTAKQLASKISDTEINVGYGGWKVAGAWNIDMKDQQIQEGIWDSSSIHEMFMKNKSRSLTHYEKICSMY